MLFVAEIIGKRTVKQITIKEFKKKES